MSYGKVYRERAHCDHCDEDTDLVVGSAVWSDEVACAKCLSELQANLAYWSKHFGIKVVADPSMPPDEIRVESDNGAQSVTMKFKDES